MTEREWAECSDPDRMLEFLYSCSSSERKFSQFAVACCRRIWYLIIDNRSRRGVDIAERFINASVTGQEWQGILQAAKEVVREARERASTEPTDALRTAAASAYAAYSAIGGDSVFEAARYAAESLANQVGTRFDGLWTTAFQAERTVQCDLLRDLFGSPYYTATIDPSWRSWKDGELVRTVEGIDNEGRFDALPHLAETLARAGCQDEEILAHCRQYRPHIRGCWVVDALLGKEPPIRIGLNSQQAWLTCPDPNPLLAFLKHRGSDRKWRLFAIACCRRISPLITDFRSRQAVEVAEQFANGHAGMEELTYAHAAADAAADKAGLVEWDAEAEANFCHTEKHSRVAAISYAAEAAASVCRQLGEPDSELECGWFYARLAVAQLAQSETVALFAKATNDAAIYALAVAKKAEVAEASHQADVLRDIFGHLFGPMTNCSAWLPFADPYLCGSPNPSSTPVRRCLLPSPLAPLLNTAWLQWNDGTVRKMAQAIYEEAAFDRLPILADALEEAGCTEANILLHCRAGGEHVRGCWVIDMLMGKE